MSSQPPTKKELEAQLASALGEVGGLRQQLDGAQVEIRLLRAKLDALARRMFGKKSEQLSSAQLQLLLQEQTAPGPALGAERSEDRLAVGQPTGRIKSIRPTGV